MMTYFISDGTFVKIGKSRDPYARLASLQTAHPRQLVILLVLDDDREQEMHALFKDDRCEGEWFNLSESLQAFLNQQDARVPTTGTLRCIGMPSGARCTRKNLSTSFCLTCPVGPMLYLSDERQLLLAQHVHWETLTEACSILGVTLREVKA